MMFELLGLMEYYHPRMQLRLQLARIMILNLLNLYSLIWALFGKINGMTIRLTEIVNSTLTTTVEPLLASSEPTKFTTAIPKVMRTSTISSSTMRSTTENIFARVTEMMNQSTTDYATYPTDPTENYDYSNTNYFEYEEPDTQLSSTEATTTAEPFLNFTDSLLDLADPFYIENDFGNFSDYSGDLFRNSNFNMTNLINSSGFNDSFLANISNLVFNDTYVQPIASAYESVQYSFLQQEVLPSINTDNLNDTTKLELRRLCWETMFGQELVKLTVMDLVINVADVKNICLI